jgi:hypothetical protein
MPDWIKISGVTLLLGVAGADLGLRTASVFSGDWHADQWIEHLLPEGRMDWTAAATIGLFVATVALAVATVYLGHTASVELRDTRDDNRSARVEQKIERTVAICVRYEADIMLVESVRRLRAEPAEPIEEYAHDINLLLNYLDTIAIGLEEEIYEERRARKFMENILVSQCERFLNERVLSTIGLEMEHFDALQCLYEKWRPPAEGNGPPPGSGLAATARSGGAKPDQTAGASA